MRNIMNVLKIVLVILICVQYSFSQSLQNKDTLYFDSNWEVTTKENHEFYRPLPLNKIGDLSLIVDFYKNGNMQMQGYAYTDSIAVFAGDVYWYDKNGFDITYEQYINSTNNALKYYYKNGVVWKTVNYKNNVKEGKIKIFNDKGNFVSTETYSNGLIAGNTVGKFHKRYYFAKHNKAKTFNKNVPQLQNFTKVLYWMHTGNVAKNTKYIEHTIFEERSYNQNGQKIQHLYKKDFMGNEYINGTYYTLKTKNGLAVAIDSVENDNIKSKIVDLKNISYVGADESGELNFYKKIATDDYLEIDYELLYDETIPSKSFRILGKGNERYSVKEIKKYSDKTINVSDIKTQSVENFLKTIKSKEWRASYIEPNNYSDETTKHKVIFKQFNSELFASLDVSFTDINNGGFGSYYKKADDDVKKWRLNDLEFFTINIILLNGNKPILVLSEGASIEYYIIPTNKEGLLINYKKKNAVEQNSSNLRDSVFKELMLGSNSNKFYRINSKNGKKYIANSFNEIVVDKAYDSIQRTGQYIIGRNKKNVDVYNLRLNKIPVKNIQEAYYDRGNLQILANNNVKYIDALGKETNRQHISYSFCGTVQSTDFEIIKSNKNKNLNAIIIYKGGPASHAQFTSVLLLKNLGAEYNLTFLNKTKIEGYDGNSNFVEDYVNRTNFLVVDKDKKFGLYTYNPNIEFNTEDNSKNEQKRNEKGLLEPIDININKQSYGSTIAEELLPVIYDEIELQEPLIIVKKDKKYGIYPLKNGLKYKSLGKVITNFISYETITGEKGWIDVNTLKEYPNIK